MRNPPGPYKHAGENDMNYSRTADSSLLAKRRQNFAEGGSANPSSDTLKQLVADLKLDEPTKAMTKNLAGSGTSGTDGQYWESMQPKFDDQGMPMRRVLKTPMGNIALPAGMGGTKFAGG